MQDSVVRLRTLLRRRWGITFQASSKPESSSIGGTSADVAKANTATDGGGARDAWRGSGRWTFDMNHRHGIYEGNTMLNFAGEEIHVYSPFICFRCLRAETRPRICTSHDKGSEFTTQRIPATFTCHVDIGVSDGVCMLACLLDSAFVRVFLEAHAAEDVSYGLVTRCPR